MAAELISATHAEILRLLASNTGIHFQGLSQAARTKQLGLSTRTRRHLTTLDVAHNLVRHITKVSAARLVQEVTQATSPYSELPSKPPGAFKGGVPGADAPGGLPIGSPGMLWGGMPGPLSSSPPSSQQDHGKASNQVSNPTPEVQLTAEWTRIPGYESDISQGQAAQSQNPSRIVEYLSPSPISSVNQGQACQSQDPSRIVENLSPSQISPVDSPAVIYPRKHCGPPTSSNMHEQYGLHGQQSSVGQSRDPNPSIKVESPPHTARPAAHDEQGGIVMKPSFKVLKKPKYLKGL